MLFGNKLKVVLLVIGICLIFVTISELTKYIYCQKVIRYLEDIKEDFSLGSGEKNQAVLNFDNEILKIKETHKCDFPFFCDAVLTRVNGNDETFWVVANWIQKNHNPIGINKMNVRFECEDGIEEFVFDVIPSKRTDESKNGNLLYSDAFYVAFTEDVDKIYGDVAPVYNLPFSFSNCPIYVSLTNSDGAASDWLKCEQVSYEGH